MQQYTALSSPQIYYRYYDATKKKIISRKEEKYFRKNVRKRK